MFYSIDWGLSISTHYIPLQPRSRVVSKRVLYIPSEILYHSHGDHSLCEILYYFFDFRNDMGFDIRYDMGKFFQKIIKDYTWGMT